MTATPAIRIDGATSAGSAQFRFALDVAEGTHVAVVGPNGAGKSTLLRVLAGHHALTAGTLEIGNRIVDDPASGHFVPPEDRNVGFQPAGGGLFTHLDVRDNVAFGLRCRGFGRRKARSAALAILESVDASALAPLAVGALSGGQRARVALARSLAVDHPVVLVDEPGAALDLPGRAWLRATLRRLDRTVAIVTHDAVDVLVGADLVVVVDDGTIVQAGRPAEVAARPVSAWVAAFVGLNLVSGYASGTTVTTDAGIRLELAEHARGRVHVSFPTHAVALHPQRPAGSPRNVWEATVTDLRADGDRVRVTLTGELTVTAVVTATSVDALALAPGSRCWASVKAAELSVTPA